MVTTPGERYVITPAGAEALLDQERAPPGEMPLDQLWLERESVDAELRYWRSYKSNLDAELQRRVLEARSDFTPESTGSAEIAGEDILIRMTYSREYTFLSEGVKELERLAAERPEVLTPEEYSQLVAWEPKVSGRIFNNLLRRGGLLAEMLGATRMLKSARPEFEQRARA